MTDERKPQKPGKQVEDLELNRETVQDLTEEKSEQAKGGLVAADNYATLETYQLPRCTAWGGPVGDTRHCVC
jgi:hypothetical protein